MPSASNGDQPGQLQDILDRGLVKNLQVILDEGVLRETSGDEGGPGCDGKNGLRVFSKYMHTYDLSFLENIHINLNLTP